jgi:hypothetical protein
MMLMNRELLKHMLAQNTPLKKVVNRCVGKTTAAILKALSESITTPGQLIEVKDPDLKTMCMADHCAKRARDIIAALQLEKVDVAVKRKGEGSYYVFVISNFSESLT